VAFLAQFGFWHWLLNVLLRVVQVALNHVWHVQLFTAVFIRSSGVGAGQKFGVVPRVLFFVFVFVSVQGVAAGTRRSILNLFLGGFNDNRVRELCFYIVVHVVGILVVLLGFLFVVEILFPLHAMFNIGIVFDEETFFKLVTLLVL